jgi:hypothetical protein
MHLELVKRNFHASARLVRMRGLQGAPAALLLPLLLVSLLSDRGSYRFGEV